MTVAASGTGRIRVRSQEQASSRITRHSIGSLECSASSFRPLSRSKEWSSSPCKRVASRKCPSTDDLGFTVSADRKSTRLNSSHSGESRMPSSA